LGFMGKYNCCHGNAGERGLLFTCTTIKHTIFEIAVYETVLYYLIMQR
jgi:hypothetical protein